MITIELVLNSIWQIVRNTIIAVALIAVIGKIFSFALDIPSIYTFAATFIVFVIVGIGTLYTPLFIQYSEFAKKVAENIKSLQADNNILQANEVSMRADIEQLTKDKSNLQATIVNKEQEISRLQEQESKQIAHLQIALADAKQKYATLEQQATTAGEIHLAVKAELNQLKGMENYLFLKHIGITPEQVANALTKVVAGMQNGKSDQEKERIQSILAKVKNGNVIDV